MTEFLDPDHETFGDIAGAFTDPAADPIIGDDPSGETDTGDLDAEAEEVADITGARPTR